MLLRPFILSKTSPFDWKENYLIPFRKRLYTVPCWLGKTIKYGGAIFGLNLISLNRIQLEFKKLQSNYITETDINSLFNCNKNIECLNEKIWRANRRCLTPKPLLSSLTPLPIPELQTLSHPTQTNAPNAERANNWVLRQHPSIQPLAYTLATSVIKNYITFPQFLEALDESARIAEQNIGFSPFGMIILNKPDGASGPWVADCLRLSRKPVAQLIITASEKVTWTNMHELFGAPKQITHWMVVDDALYSGQQLREQILPYAVSALRKKYLYEALTIHLVIPYVNTHGKALVETYCKRLSHENIKVLFANSRTMPNIKKVVEKLSEEDRVAGLALVDTVYRPPLRCTTYFEHKVGDHLSFPDALNKGTIKTRTYKGFLNATEKKYVEIPGNERVAGQLGFIPKFVPPYKLA